MRGGHVLSQSQHVTCELTALMCLPVPSLGPWGLCRLGACRQVLSGHMSTAVYSGCEAMCIVLRKASPAVLLWRVWCDCHWCYEQYHAQCKRYIVYQSAFDCCRVVACMVMTF